MSDIPDNLGGNESVRMPDVVIKFKPDTTEIDKIEERLRQIKEEVEGTQVVVSNTEPSREQMRPDVAPLSVVADKDDQVRASMAQIQNTLEGIDGLMRQVVQILQNMEQRQNG